MKEIVIIADNRFPLSYAATTRIYMLCKLFQSIGFQTDVYIMNVTEKRRFYLKEARINCRWFMDEKKNYFHNFTENKSIMNALRSRGSRLKYVVLYQEILFQMLPVLKVSKKCNFKVIAYFDEWYEWEKTNGNIFSKEFFQNLRIRLSEYVAAPKIESKIVISRGLKKFYKSDNCFLLPILVDLQDEIWKKECFVQENKIVIMYAGWPGARDDLKLLVETVDELQIEEKRRILVRIFTYSTTKEDLRQHIPEFDRICKENKGIIEFGGEISRSQVIKELKSADFSYLMRENKWTNNAGFSTKIGESLAAGTPMLCNCTSDIKYYIKDGINGVLISEMSKNAVKISLMKLLNFSMDDRLQMRKNAYKTAERYFDYRRYKERLKNFLNK